MSGWGIERPAGPLPDMSRLLPSRSAEGGGVVSEDDLIQYAKQRLGKDLEKWREDVNHQLKVAREQVRKEKARGDIFKQHHEIERRCHAEYKQRLEVRTIGRFFAWVALSGVVASLPYFNLQTHWIPNYINEWIFFYLLGALFGYRFGHGPFRYDGPLEGGWGYMSGGVYGNRDPDYYLETATAAEIERDIQYIERTRP